MDKKLIAPVVAVICMAVQLIFKVEIDEVVQSQIVDAIINVALVGTTIYGLFYNQRQKQNEDVEIIEK